LIVDPQTNSTSTLDFPSPGGSFFLQWIALANNNKLYCGPYLAASTLVIDPQTNFTSLVSISGEYGG